MSETNTILAPDDNSSIALWWRMMILGPLVMLVLPSAVVWPLGGFDDFQWIDQPVTFVQSLAILGTMSFPFGAFFYARSAWNQARAHASRAWPTVPGMVQASRIKQRQSSGPTFYRLALSYRYEVGGDGYEGDTVQFGPARVTARELIEALAKKYPTGTEVTVRYDPADPQTSVLETSDEMALQNRWQIWLYWGMPLFVSIVVAIKNAGP